MDRAIKNANDALRGSLDKVGDKVSETIAEVKPKLRGM